MTEVWVRANGHRVDAGAKVVDGLKLAKGWAAVHVSAMGNVLVGVDHVGELRAVLIQPGGRQLARPAARLDDGTVEVGLLLRSSAGPDDAPHPLALMIEGLA